MADRSTIGVLGPDGIEQSELFRSLLSDAGLPVDRICWGEGHEDWDYVIASGERALAQFRPDLTPGETHGRALMLPGDRILFPILHHDSYRRFAPWRAQLVEDLRLLRQIAILRKKDGPWLDLVPISCVKCRADLYRIDDNNVSYCKTHWEHRSLTPSLLITETFKQ